MQLPRQTAITGDECRARRERAGLTRVELAEIALVDPSTIYRLESGKHVSRNTRRRLAAALPEV